MQHLHHRRWAPLWVAPLCAALAFTMPAISVKPASARHETGSVVHERVAFNRQQLDQMLAPIALYPDSLLSQILMAATYPLEVVEAARWSRANRHLHGRDAVRAVEHMPWDPSVKSLVAFPRILAMMDERLQWTRDLGDAFLEQEPHVMDAIQELRRRALAAGSLRSGREVVVEQRDRWIYIEPAEPAFAYVPYYDPIVAYGPWWWPAYPPVRWAPWPGYAVGPATVFYWGPAITVGTVFFFGTFDWPRRYTTVVHRHEHNVYIDRTTIVNRAPAPTRSRWLHDPMHRRGIDYRSEAVRRRIVQEQPARADSRANAPRSRAAAEAGRGPGTTVQAPPAAATADRKDGNRAAPPPSRGPVTNAAETPPDRRSPAKDRSSRAAARVAPTDSGLRDAAKTDRPAANTTGDSSERTTRNQRAVEPRNRLSDGTAAPAKGAPAKGTDLPDKGNRSAIGQDGKRPPANASSAASRWEDAANRDGRAREPSSRSGPAPNSAAAARESAPTRSAPTAPRASRAEPRQESRAAPPGKDHGKGAARAEKRERGDS